MNLQQLSVSRALYRLTATVAKSSFFSLTPSDRGLAASFAARAGGQWEVICSKSLKTNPLQAVARTSL